jgi:hypothetical protein
MNFSKIQKYLHFDRNKVKHTILENAHFPIDLSAWLIKKF